MTGAADTGAATLGGNEDAAVAPAVDAGAAEAGADVAGGPPNPLSPWPPELGAESLTALFPYGDAPGTADGAPVPFP